MLWAGRLEKIMATRKRHSPEQIVRKLMAADRLLAGGMDTAAVCRELGVTRGGDAVFQNLIPGAKGQPHVTLKGAHFLQEDCPDEIVTVIEGVVHGRG